MERGPLFLIEREEGVRKNARADLAQQLVVEVDVVLAEKLPAEGFPGFREVVEVGARIPPAGRAVARRIELLLGEFIDAAPQLQVAARGENPAPLRDLRRDDAVEHVHAPVHRLENVEWRAHAHEVARLVLWQKARRERARVLALAFPLADRKPSDRESVETHLRQAQRAFAPQPGKQRPLHDPEHRLRRIPARREAARRPAPRQF